jgi:hypothetical protein
MGKSIDKKFKSRFSGTLQFVANYEEFSEVDIGDNLGILAHGAGNEFAAFFEGAELKKRYQIVFLQQECTVNNGPVINEKKRKVVQYKLPLNGKIYLNDFTKGKIKEYPVD